MIRSQSTARYLGVIFDQRLHWRDHVKHMKTRVRSRINLLRFLNKITPESNETIMLNLYKSLVQPILTYGSSVPFNAEDKIWDRLQVAQNSALREALVLPHFTSATYIHKLSNIPYM